MYTLTSGSLGTKKSTGDNMCEQPLWRKFVDIDKLPLDALCLFEVWKRDETEIVSGTIFKSNGGRSRMGIIGGHFHFDEEILRWANIDHLKPEPENKTDETPNSKG